MPDTITNSATTSATSMICLDLGSQAIRHGLVDSQHRLSEFRSEPYETDAVRDVGLLVDQIRRLIVRTIAAQPDKPLGGIGIAVPGFVDSSTRRVLDIANLPDLSSIDLQSKLESEFGVPVTIEHNARAAACAEWRQGGARGVENFLYLHLGSNFSAGLVLDGRLLLGGSGQAGAIGRMNIYVEHLASSVRLEELVSASNIVRRTKLRLQRDSTSSLSRLSVGGEFSYDDIIDCAHKGDQLSRMMIDRTGTFIAITIADVISLLNLSMISIGGAVPARQFLVEAIDREVRKRISQIILDGCQIVAATLGPEATVLGVGMVAWEKLGNQALG